MLRQFRSTSIRMKLENLYYCLVGEILALAIEDFLDFNL